METLPLEKVWGIGKATAESLRRQGFAMAQQFTSLTENYVQQTFSKPLVETWYELRGSAIHLVHSGSREKHKSIAKTRMFPSPTGDTALLFSELSKNIEAACARARRFGLVAREISFFLKTTEFRYHTTEVRLPEPTSSPEEILRAVEQNFGRIYRPGMRYRASGITLRAMSDAGALSDGLFGGGERLRNEESVHGIADRLSGKFGKNTIFLASSFSALEKRKNISAGKRSAKKIKTDSFWRLPILYLGEVL